MRQSEGRCPGIHRSADDAWTGSLLVRRLSKEHTVTVLCYGNIPEKVELVTGTKDMPCDKFLEAWLYSWMINTFHNFGWSQAITRFLRRYKNFTYLEMYDHLFQALKEDDGVVGGFYKHAKSQMEHYLETGIDSNMEDGWSGHTYMWQVQPDFHRNRQHIVDFVNKTFNIT